MNIRLSAELSLGLLDDLTTASSLGVLLGNDTAVVSSRGAGVLRGTLNLTGKLFKSLALGLRDEESGEETEQHEKSEDLHDVRNEGKAVLGVGTLGASGWSTSVLERTEHNLGNDGTDLSGGGRETVGGRSVTSGETLSGNDESSGVGAEVEEELGQNVESKETVRAELVPGESNNTEDDCEHEETHKLDRLASDGIAKGNGEPVSRDGTSADDDQVTDGVVVQDLVDAASTGVVDGSQNDGGVKRQSVESNIEEEP